MQALPSVGQLWRYPVKSLGGELLAEVLLDRRGVVGDRAFAVRDKNGKLGSGKTTRRFRRLRDLLDFSARTDGDGVVVLPPGEAGMRVGDLLLDALLSARYGDELTVVPEEAGSHFDAAPVHILTSSSLAWVEKQYGQGGGDPRRYRPNIVVDTDAEELVEEQWLGATLRIGTCALQVSERVERCVMPTYRQNGLRREPGLLRFLVERNAKTLGVYAQVTTPGTIGVGDAVIVERP